MKVRGLNFATRIIAIVFAILLLSDVVVGVVVYKNESKALSERIIETGKSVADSASACIEREGLADQLPTLQAGMEESELFQSVRSITKMFEDQGYVEFVYTVTSDGKSAAFQVAVAGEDVMTVGDSFAYQDAIGGALTGTTTSGDEYTDEYGSHITSYSPIYDSNKKVVGVVGVDISTSIVSEELAAVKRTIMGTCLAAIVLGMILLVVVLSVMIKPVAIAQNVALHLAEGDLELNVPATKRRDEIGILQNSMSTMKDSISGMIKEANYILAQISDYNLAIDDMKAYPGEFNELTESINSIKGILNEVIMMVKEASIEVYSGSNQLTLAADALAQSTTAEAMSIQNLQSSMQNINDKIRSSSDNCNQVNEKLGNLSREIENGNQGMRSLYEAVEKTEKMSADIRKIVDSIDTIAFQTNILALNASVEAARAGEVGKGFTVVAEEVRSLAAKCAEESQKTAQLINECLNAVAQAKDHADMVSDSMDVMVRNSQEIANAFEQISESTSEQARNSEEIMDEINKITDVVQSNTATAEETAASTQELSSQSERLQGMIARFKV